jgi:predicted transcriptional regulator
MVNEMNDFKEVFSRLEKLEITTQQDLAKSLDITQSAVSDAKKRGKFPRRWAEKLSKKFDISLDFLLSGEHKEQMQIPDPSSMSELYERLLIAERKNATLKERIKQLEASSLTVVG